MKEKILFDRNESLCNPSIVETEEGIVGIVKRWDFNNNPYFEGTTFLFRLDKKLNVKEINEVKCMKGVRDYTLFKNENYICALLYKKKQMNYVTFNGEDIFKIKINIKGLLPFTSFIKNLSPIEKDKGVIDYVYSIKPFITIKMEDNQFNCELRQIKRLELHGGIRFIKFNEKELISLCHTYNGKRNRYYKIYLVTISNNYPYKLIRMSTIPILEGNIIEDNFMPNKNCLWLNKNAKVVFERGIAKVKDNFIISYGVQDKESRLLIATYNELDSLLDKKIDVKEVI